MSLRRTDLPGPLGPPEHWRHLQHDLQRQGQTLLGTYRRQAQPEGLTIRQLRPYEPGDDPRRLDWAASARQGTPIVRDLEDEHGFPVWTVVDTSLAMFWGSHALRRIDVAARMTLAIGHCVLASDDCWGLAYGSKGLEQATLPRLGRSAWREGWLKLAAARPLAEPGNLPHLLEGFRRLVRQRSLIVLLSAFPQGHWQRHFARLAADHAVVALHLVDPLDRELPATGLTALTDPETGRSEVYDLTAGTVARANRLAAQQRAEVAAFCQDMGAAYAAIHTDRPWIGPLRQALGRRHSAVRAAGR